MCLCIYIATLYVLCTVMVKVNLVQVLWGGGLELTVIITVHLIQVLGRAIASTPGPGYHYPGVTSAWQVCMANAMVTPTLCHAETDRKYRECQGKSEVSSRMCGRGCTLEGGNPGVSLPLHNVWERMYTGGGKSWSVPTSA